MKRCELRSASRPRSDIAAKPSDYVKPPTLADPVLLVVRNEKMFAGHEHLRKFLYEKSETTVDRPFINASIALVPVPLLELIRQITTSAWLVKWSSTNPHIRTATSSSLSSYS